MRLTSGARLAQYEIISPLGAGGMGAVYRARDTKLGRDVAIKVLPGDFAADGERMARFEREARLLASLNHPHIASIHDFADLDGAQFLVMELAAGETLETRMQRGALGSGETLAIARQIAEALEAAHARGIIHRDLKPANVMVDDEGKVKVLDFGLARANDPDPEADQSNSPTMVRAQTHAGVILGTAGYMSPEQARGKRVDSRADIWALGVLLWEMLTGKRLFAGETVSDTLAAVLTDEVDFSKLPAGTPPQIEWVLRRCLEREQKRRFRDAADVRIALDAEPLVVQGRRTSGVRYLTLVGILAVAVAAMAGWQLFGRAEQRPKPLHVALPLPEGTRLALSGIQPGPPALSPDGGRVALVLDEATGSRRLWVRDLGSSQARPLEGTDGASYPFWSADGKDIGFFAAGQLKRVPAGGGSVLVVTNAPNAKGGSWNREGVIIFAPLFNSGIDRVAASGGAHAPVTTVDLAAGEISHRFPQFLSDGKRFLYFARRRGERASRVMLGSVEGGTASELLETQANATFAGGHLLFLRGRTLMAQPFDEQEGRLTGAPRPVADGLRVIPGAGRTVTSAASDVLLYQTGDIQTRVRLQWVNRKGETIAAVGEPQDIRSRRISPDATQIAAQIGTDLWILDADSGNKERLTYQEGGESSPVWSPDGRQIAFAAYGDRNEVRIETVPPSGTPKTLVSTPYPEGRLRPTSWSPDGAWLLYEDESLRTNRTSIMLLDLARGGEPRLLAEVATEPFPQFSPDGRWIAFDNLNNEGIPTVFVVAFPDVQRRWQVAEGEAPFWRGDGKELFFQGLDGHLQAVDVRSTPSAFAWGSPSRLFQIYTAPQTVDGERFLVSRDLGEDRSDALKAILNWRALLEEPQD